MKIALSTSVIQRGKTGVAQYVFALVRSLLQHADEHDFHLLVLEEDLPLFEFARGRMTLVPVSEKWRPAVRNIFWHQFLLPRWLRQHDIDVLHVPSYRRMPFYAPCATVATIHDLAPFHVKGKYDLARMLYGRLMVKWLARRQDQILAVSTHTAQDIQRFFHIPLERQRVILNGLDHARFHPAPAKPQPGLEQPYFLYISRLEHPAKNHVRLIEAFNRFKAATGSPWLLALGGSDWHGAEHIHAAAAASPYAADIRFLGFVPDDALPDLYRSAGAFVYPSLFEGFGLPPVEAMACGCPVISSAAGALAEVIGTAARVIDPENIDSIQHALQALATSAPTRRRLIQLGLENARRFNWDTCAARVLQAFRSTLPSPPVGGIVPRPRLGDASGVTPFSHVRLSSPLEPRSTTL
jgi:glycosyltransferase involved in cell wall biosynthesis